VLNKSWLGGGKNVGWAVCAAVKLDLEGRQRGRCSWQCKLAGL
jgi:hypothetical protein